MPVKINPIVLHIRGYNDSEIDINKSLNELKMVPYSFICTIQIIDDVGWISGFMGKLTLSLRREIKKQLKKDYGLVKVNWKRSNKDVTVF